MRTSIKTSAAALAAVGFAFASAAGAADGRPPQGRLLNSEAVEAFTFDDDGVMRGVTSEGIHVHDTYVISGDAVMFTASDDHPLCPGAIGVYRFEETETEVKFTLVFDECERRANGLPSETWYKQPDEDAE